MRHLTSVTIAIQNSEFRILKSAPQPDSDSEGSKVTATACNSEF